MGPFACVGASVILGDSRAKTRKDVGFYTLALPEILLEVSKSVSKNQGALT